jgi:hypothetical protein
MKSKVVWVVCSAYNLISEHVNLAHILFYIMWQYKNCVVVLQTFGNYDDYKGCF